MATPAPTIHLLFVFQLQGWRKRREPKAGAMREVEVVHTLPLKVRPTTLPAQNPLLSYQLMLLK